MTYVDTGDANAAASDLSNTLDGLQSKANALTLTANGFASAMIRAFTQAASGGKQFDDVLKSLALRLSELALKSAFKSLTSGLSGSLGNLLSGLFGSITGNAMGAIKPFAAGGVIGTPTYFPLMNGGVGLAGEAGPEAIVPLQRGADGRLGVAFGGATAAPNVTVQIATPDLESFRRSEAYITGQIARAVARGQRSL